MILILEIAAGIVLGYFVLAIVATLLEEEDGCASGCGCLVLIGLAIAAVLFFLG